MTRTRMIWFPLFLFFSVSYTSNGQDIKSIMLQAESLEKSFRDQEALDKYLEVIRFDPNNINALCKASELYSIVGKRQRTKEKEREYYHKGLDHAKKALKLNPRNSEANFAMAISMGRIALISSGDEKIKAVKEIRTYADKCIQIDPRNYKGYHVLGKWHYEVSDLSSVERWLVKVTYGALPPASLDDAVRNYEKSRQLFPTFLLNYLELAKAYKRKGEKKKALALLQQLEKLPPATSDDPKIKQLGRKMLNDL
jgi:tetratricopeptide (TPR) repeat protein